jgi:hypothetical protein
MRRFKLVALLVVATTLVATGPAFAVRLQPGSGWEPGSSGEASAEFGYSMTYYDETGNKWVYYYWTVTVTCQGLTPYSVYYVSDGGFDRYPVMTDETGSFTRSFQDESYRNTYKSLVFVSTYLGNIDGWDYYETVLSGEVRASGKRAK